MAPFIKQRLVCWFAAKIEIGGGAMGMIVETPPAVIRFGEGEAKAALCVTPNGKRQGLDDPVAESAIGEIGLVDIDNQDDATMLLARRLWVSR